MTEKEKMLAGELYDSSDPELKALLARARRLCEEYNRTPGDDGARQKEILNALLGGTGKHVHIEPHIWFDYGFNTTVGENFYCNHDCVFLDCNRITFGDDVLIGPQCGFYAAGHPLDVSVRLTGKEYAAPIKVGTRVWIGGGVKIMPGVTIGDDCVIGGGSVVVKDIPAGCLAAGNPAKVIRRLSGGGN